MPGFNLGFNQRNFNGSRPTSTAAVNMGATRGKGSTTRMLNYCKTHSTNPSGCINQFIYIAPPPPTPTILVYSASQGSSFVWSGATFTLDTSLPNYSYTAITSSIPATQLPQARTLLTGVTIGNSVTSIGANAFSGCSNLTSVIFTQTSKLTIIDTNAFLSCVNLTSVTIPNSVLTIGYNAFGTCSKLSSVTIPNSVQTIVDYAFNTCIALTSIIIPASVTSIGEGAFNSCTGLTTVTFTATSTLTSIPTKMFLNCVNLTSITIPNSVTSIGDFAFQLCGKLPSIRIPALVNSIGGSAFQSCTLLTTVYIGQNPQTISGTPYSGGQTVTFFGKANVSIVYPPP
jgi:hypothetical protein